jgi:glutamate racemase
MIDADIDLVLGCSHYPYLIPPIKKSISNSGEKSQNKPESFTEKSGLQQKK